MDHIGDVSQVLDSQLLVSNDRYITDCEAYGVSPFVFTLENLRWLWDEMAKYRTLFSDITAGDLDNFVNLVTLSNSRWYVVERKADQQVVGVLYLTDIQPTLSCVAHVIFFDRQFADKVAVVREHLRWVIQELRIHRVTAIVPRIYHATIRFALRVGFVQEGVFRESILIGGKWIDEILLGALAPEV